jgi:hypothetical protein
MVPCRYVYWFLAAAAALMAYLMYLSSTGTPPAVVVGCVGLLSAVAAVAIIWTSTPLHPWQVRSNLDVLLQPTHQVTIFRHYLIGRGQLQSEQPKFSVP